MFDSVECSSHIHERDLQIGYCGIGTKRQETKRRETKRHERQRDIRHERRDL